MKSKENKLKKALKNDEVVYGTCMCALSPNIVELAGYSGFDWCRIDTEHNWRRDGIVEHMIRASEKANISPIVRIDKDDPYLIRKVLEIGAMGFIVPAIKEAEEVREVVKAAKFPPLGERGYSSLNYSGEYGTIPGEEWTNWSNENTMVGVMIETKEAVENIDEIMSIDGLDFVLFGPADYSMSIGLGSPQKDHPKVQKAIKATIASAKENGKYVMLGVGTPWKDQADKYIEMGVNMIEIGHDYSVLGRAWRSALNEVKK